MMLDITGEIPKVADYIDTGRLYLDGSVIYGALDGVVRDRLRMAMNGLVMVSLILEDEEVLGDPWCELRGLPEQGRSRAPLAELLEREMGAYLERAGRRTMKDDDALEEGLRRVVRQLSMEEIGKKPEVSVVISRLSED
jgi:ribonuclease J